MVHRVMTDAQQQAKIPKIGWLAAGPASVPGGASELFLRELGQLGYVDGTNELQALIPPNDDAPRQQMVYVQSQAGT